MKKTRTDVTVYAGYVNDFVRMKRKPEAKLFISPLSKKQLVTFDTWLADSIDNLDNKLARKIRRAIKAYFR